MRQIVLDTETTGLNPNTGDRIIEIGCVELLNRRLTGRTLHHYVNPERPVDAGAIAVHGLTNAFLNDKPKMGDIVDAVLEFVAGAEIIIHNAPFDVGFLDAELKRLSRPVFRSHVGNVIDTLQQARQMFPGKRNSLDALCERLGIRTAHRVLHGALLDAELLADAYLAMTRGQNTLETTLPEVATQPVAATFVGDATIATLITVYADRDESAEHERWLDDLDTSAKRAVWRMDGALVE